MTDAGNYTISDGILLNGDDKSSETMWFENAKNLHNILKTKKLGAIRDADTVLNDIMEDNMDDFYEQSGIADELFSIYEQSSDKNTFKQMFKLFVGCEFEEFCFKVVDVMEHTKGLFNSKKGDKNEADH